MTSVRPRLLNTDTLPPEPSCTLARLAIVRPGTQLRFDAFGRPKPVGHTVRKLLPVVFVTVMFKTTEVAFVGIVSPPVSGFEAPVICKSIVAPSPRGPAAATPRGVNGAGRVSRIRNGVIGTKSEEAPELAPANWTAL